MSWNICTENFCSLTVVHGHVRWWAVDEADERGSWWSHVSYRGDSNQHLEQEIFTRKVIGDPFHANTPRRCNSHVMDFNENEQIRLKCCMKWLWTFTDHKINLIVKYDTLDFASCCMAEHLGDAIRISYDDSSSYGGYSLSKLPYSLE